MATSMEQLRALTVGAKPKLAEEIVEYEGAKFYVRSIPYGKKSEIDTGATNIDWDDDGNKTVEFDTFYYETRVLMGAVYNGSIDDPEAEKVFGKADLERIKQEGLSADSWLYLLLEPAKGLNKKGGNYEKTEPDSDTGTSVDG